MKEKKEIKVSCQGAATATLEDLYPLQGDLKSLPEESYQKLKRALIKYGFSFPLFVWRHKAKLFTLDGHQRDRALKRMKEEGFRIPRLPVDYIQARVRVQFVDVIPDPSTGRLKRGKTCHVTVIGISAKEAASLFKKAIQVSS